MIRLRDLLRRLAAWLAAPTDPIAVDADFTPSQWADLPPHHPRCEKAPC